MSSQRHKREQRFQDRAQADTDAALPMDSADETADDYGELPQWPDADRDTDSD
jgi:hypothetical protein